MAAIASGSAFAGPALDDDKAAAAPAPSEPLVPAGTEDPVQYGVGIRLRTVQIPHAMIDLFVARSAGGTSNTGVGVELTRRRGTVELQLGFEFEHITAAQGVWIEKGKAVPADESDYILTPENSSNHPLGWFTIEFTFLNHAKIAKDFYFRYGGGAGLGIITGELDHYNIQCAAGSTNTNVDPGCVPPLPQFTGPSGMPGRGTFTEGGTTPSKYDLPPVFPVINAIVGLQYRPTPMITVNLEGGIRTIPFLGLSGAYFF